MNSSIGDLRRRGYIDDLNIDCYYSINEEVLNNYLISSKAFERTIAVHILSKYNLNKLAFTQTLLDMLKKEKALYTKIEICNVLSKLDEDNIKLVIGYLGVIGNNQHKEIPNKIVNKKSFPLPRDIIARTLGRMEEDYLSLLFQVLNSKDITKISEVFDAIGLYIYYHKEHANKDNFLKIQSVIESFHENQLILWKGILCLSVFPLELNKNYLNKLKREISHDIIKKEIERSLSLIQ